MSEQSTVEDKPRGKRALGIYLLLFLALLTAGGFWNEGAWDMAKFYTPFIFPLVGALYLGDGYFANQRVLGNPKGGR